LGSMSVLVGLVAARPAAQRGRAPLGPGGAQPLIRRAAIDRGGSCTSVLCRVMSDRAVPGDGGHGSRFALLLGTFRGPAAPPHRRSPPRCAADLAHSHVRSRSGARRTGRSDPGRREIPLLTLQQLPHHQPRHRLHRAETMLASRLTPPASKILQLFPCQHRRATLLIGLLLRSSVLNTRYDRACHPDLQNSRTRATTSENGPSKK